MTNYIYTAIFVGLAVNIILSIFIGNIGAKRKIGDGAAFTVSLFFGPLIGLIVTLASDELPKESFTQTVETPKPVEEAREKTREEILEQKRRENEENEKNGAIAGLFIIAAFIIGIILFVSEFS